MDVEPVLSADHEVSADSQDALHEEDAAHVDVERPGEHLTPNISAMEKSAERNGIIQNYQCDHDITSCQNT